MHLTKPICSNQFNQKLILKNIRRKCLTKKLNLMQGSKAIVRQNMFDKMCSTTNI